MAKVLNKTRKGKVGGIFNVFMEATLAATGGAQSSIHIRLDVTPRRRCKFSYGEVRSSLCK